MLKKKSFFEKFHKTTPAFGLKILGSILYLTSWWRRWCEQGRLVPL